MCGIAGIVGNGAGKLIDSFILGMAHRGPDGSGKYENNAVSLGHTRLAIQDLSEKGTQPMRSSDDNFVLVFNGEIYNHLELRKELEHKYSFKGTSDTETLLSALIEYGRQILPRLKGIFAFAFYNVRKQELIIARDQLGVKPVYYYTTEDLFLFSSESKVFFNHPLFKSELSVSGLANYINLLWSPGEETANSTVKRLLPGQYMQVDCSSYKVYIKQYYGIPFNGDYLKSTESEIIIKLKEQLKIAIDRQLLSDVPIGFFLSGGVDSSALVAIVRQLYPDRKIQCFALDTSEVSQTEGFSNDLHYARLVADYLKVELEIVKPPNDPVALLDEVIYHLDEPIADVAALNVYAICKRASEMGYKVLMGGTGADDVFSGYRRHRALAYQKTLDRLPRPISKLVSRAAGRLGAKNPTLRRIKKLTTNIDTPKTERMAGYFSWMEDDLVKSLFRPEFKGRLDTYDSTSFFKTLLTQIPEEQSDLNKMLFWEMKSFLVDDNLTYTDKMGMAHGVEIRVPYLDIDLVNFSTTIPPELKMKGRKEKYILKEAVRDYLPQEIIDRDKVGFGAPVRKWVKADLKEYIQTELLRKGSKFSAVFDIKSVQQLVDNNLKGKIDASYSIWALLCINSWLKQFYNSNDQDSPTV